MIAPRPIAQSAAERVLSARQLEVLALIARGLSTEGIAGELVVSPCTVRAHVRNILGILGARNRAHAVAIACLTGLIGIDECAAPRERDRAHGCACDIGGSEAPPSSDAVDLAAGSSRPSIRLITTPTNRESDEQAPGRCRCDRPQSPDDAVPRRPNGKLMAPLAPREKALLIYALAVYAKMANGGPAVTSTLISRMLDSDQVAEINDLVRRRLELDHRSTA